MYTKQELLELGKRYYKEIGEIPAAKKWTKKAGYCSRSWIYREFGNWPTFLKELGFTENNSQRKNRLAKKEKNKLKYVPYKNQLEDKLILVENTLEFWVNKYLEEEVEYWPSNKISKEKFKNAIINPVGKLNKKLGCSTSAVYKIKTVIFPNKSDQSKYSNWILNFYNRKYCSKCSRVFDKEYFQKNSSMLDGLQSHCVFCRSRDQKSYFSKGCLRSKNQAPLWGKKGIREFYDNCPEGYQVDHVIPLNGKYVSGLHVINNLQYLTVSDNYKKKNYHNSENYWK